MIEVRSVEVFYSSEMINHCDYKCIWKLICASMGFEKAQATASSLLTRRGYTLRNYEVAELSKCNKLWERILKIC